MLKRYIHTPAYVAGAYLAIVGLFAWGVTENRKLANDACNSATNLQVVIERIVTAGHEANLAVADTQEQRDTLVAIYNRAINELRSVRC